MSGHRRGKVFQVDVGQSLENALANVVEWLPRLVGFILILLAAWIVARLLEKATDALLEKVGFDRWVTRGGIDRAMRNVPYDPSSMVAKLVFFAVMLFGLQLAFSVFGPNPISDLISGAIAYLPNLVVAIVIIVIAAFLADLVRNITASALSRVSYGNSVATGAYIAILGLGVFAALDQLNVAENIVNGLFYALLAIVAGSLIIAIGGGGIEPMRERWGRALAKLDQEAPQLKDGSR
jgi:hypothetical protein